MEPKIYKPSIYKGAGIYKTGAEGGGGDFVKIGGRKYPFVKIGSLYWITENLDFKFDGLVIGSGTSSIEARANYYNNNETEYGESGKKWGLLYNYKAVEKLKQTSFDKNFRLPTPAEIDAFRQNAPSTLISETFGGTNETGFNCLLSGAFFDGSFMLANTEYYSWTNETKYFFNLNLGGTSVGYTDPTHGMSVRLCANV